MKRTRPPQKVKAQADRNRPGKPGPKRVFTKDQLEAVIDLKGKAGARDVDLAEYFEVDVSTIDYWKRHYAEFRSAYFQAKMVCTKQVTNALYKRATGFWITRNRSYQTRVVHYDENGNPTQSYDELVPYQEQVFYPPNVSAATKFLSILYREVWSESKDLNVNHNVSGEVNHKQVNEIKLDELSPEVQDMLFELNMKQIQDGENNN